MPTEKNIDLLLLDWQRRLKKKKLKPAPVVIAGWLEKCIQMGGEKTKNFSWSIMYRDTTSLLNGLRCIGTLPGTPNENSEVVNMHESK